MPSQDDLKIALCYKIKISHLPSTRSFRTCCWQANHAQRRPTVCSLCVLQMRDKCNKRVSSPQTSSSAPKDTKVSICKCSCRDNELTWTGRVPGSSSPSRNTVFFIRARRKGQLLFSTGGQLSSNLQLSLEWFDTVALHIEMTCV